MAAGPGPLEVVAAEPAGDVDDFADAPHGSIDVEDLRAWIEQGKTRTDIAKDLGKSIYTVDSWLRRARRIDPDFPGTITKTGKRRPPRNKERSAEAKARSRERMLKDI